MAVGPSELGKLTNGFAGEIVRPDDPGYDAARTVWNSMIDRRPALIVRPTGTDDVIAALRFAREQELVIAVRCGGHSIPGFSTMYDQAAKAAPLGRNATSQEVGKLGLFLLSDLASGITGQVVYVDAGSSVMAMKLE